MSQLFGFFLWNKGLAIGGIARVSQTQLLQPFITLSVAYLLLGEAFDVLTVFVAIAVAMVVFVGKNMQIKALASNS